MSGPRPAVLAAYVAFVAVAGANFVAVRISNFDLPPFWGAFLRFFYAGVLFFAFVAVWRLPLPRGRQLIGALVYGATSFGLSYALAYYALVGLNSGSLAVTMATVPLLTLLLAILHRLETFAWRALAGAIVSLIGLAIILLDQLDLRVSPGFLLAGILAALAVSESTVLVKYFPRGHPVSTNAVAMVTGSTLLLLLSWAVGEAHVIPTGRSIVAALAYLVLVGSMVLFGLFLFLIQRLKASTLSYQFVLSPIVTILVANWLLRETVTWTFLVGGLIVAVGVFLGARPTPVATHAAAPISAAAPQNDASANDAPRP